MFDHTRTDQTVILTHAEGIFCHANLRNLKLSTWFVSTSTLLHPITFVPFWFYIANIDLREKKKKRFHYI